MMLEYAGIFEQQDAGTALVIDDMIGWWKLDEGAGTTINDSSGNGFTGTANAGVWTQTGTGKGYSRAFEFQGTNYINIGDIAYNDAFTVACWVKLSNVTTKYHGVFHKGNADSTITASDLEWRLYVTNGLVTILAQDATPSTILSLGSSMAVPAVDTWCHIAGVFRGNGNTCSVYINGVNLGDATQGGTIRNTTSAIQLGSRTASNGNNWMIGMMQDARLYDRPLSDAEIALLHSTTDV